MLTTMDREINRLSRLVADLLTLSRLDAEHSLNLAPLELGPLVLDVVNQVKLMANGQEIVLELKASPVVRGDPDRLKQVLLNLAANSLAFTPDGGRVVLRLEQLDGQARLTVADTGCGIPPDVLPRVMDRFVRGDPSRARATGGSGLGLAIARGIVETHGGTIAIASQLGQGTTVTISLPLAAGPASANVQLSRAEASDRDAILKVDERRGVEHGVPT
jgi:signal transduction histidine kinase